MCRSQCQLRTRPLKPSLVLSHICLVTYRVIENHKWIWNKWGSNGFILMVRKSYRVLFPMFLWLVLVHLVYFTRSHLVRTSLTVFEKGLGSSGRCLIVNTLLFDGCFKSVELRYLAYERKVHMSDSAVLPPLKKICSSTLLCRIFLHCLPTLAFFCCWIYKPWGWFLSVTECKIYMLHVLLQFYYRCSHILYYPAFS